MTDTSDNSEYSGAALSSFILALAGSRSIVDKLLADAGVDEIDPETWYDYEWSMSFYSKIEAELGKDALAQVGRSMIEAATYPPEIDNIRTLLSGLGQWFELNARGSKLGTLSCEWEDEHTAVIENTIHQGRCALNIGIIEGACARYGIEPLIEHGADTCKDEGGTACIYRVSW